MMAKALVMTIRKGKSCDQPLYLIDWFDYGIVDMVFKPDVALRRAREIIADLLREEQSPAVAEAAA